MGDEVKDELPEQPMLDQESPEAEYDPLSTNNQQAASRWNPVHP
jgi:hypothetical protein